MSETCFGTMSDAVSAIWIGRIDDFVAKRKSRLDVRDVMVTFSIGKVKKKGIAISQAS